MTTATRAFRLGLLTSAAAVVVCCGGSGGSSGGNSSSPAPPPATANVAAMAVDGGPLDSSGTPEGTINQAYVTVTICVPNTTNCQTIDHVWVDTGSTGLRLFSSSFTSQLPAQTQSGTPVANCISFVSMSYMWGAMRTADVKISGETASSMPIQIINDPSVPVATSAPSTCSNGGTAITTVNVNNTPPGLGANGLLGVGVFLQDCGITCAQSASNSLYYVCPNGTCAEVAEAVAAQNQNFGGMLSANNNGVLIQLEALPNNTASTATGSLIFGIGTQSNNALGAALVFQTDNSGDIRTTTTYGDLSETASYVDSGTNFWQFNDSSITQCTGNFVGFYCNATTLSLSATMLPFNNATVTNSFTYNFTIANASNLTGNAQNNIGGPSVPAPCSPCTFAWGLPFFYGRSVYVGFEQTTINGNVGPFFASSTP